MAACSFIKPDGSRCKAFPMRGQQFCFTHNPATATKRKRASQRGGFAGGRGRPQQELYEIKQRLKELSDMVMAGTCDRSDAYTAGQLLNFVIRAISVQLKAKEVEEMEERLELLEEELDSYRSMNGWSGFGS
jgi:hypothetical protein